MLIVGDIMKYEIAEKRSVYGEVIDFIKTTENDTLHIVDRDTGYRIRRTSSNPWAWDLSETVYYSLEEAEDALLSGNIPFRLGG